MYQQLTSYDFEVPVIEGMLGTSMQTLTAQSQLLDIMLLRKMATDVIDQLFWQHAQAVHDPAMATLSSDGLRELWKM